MSNACTGVDVEACPLSSCSVVRKNSPPQNGQPHYCRQRRSKKRASPATSPRRRLERIAFKLSDKCNTFSLEQRGATCYMAAATLMFGRVAMKYAASLDVKQYVRRSMANLWDEAQGDKEHEVCPNIPLDVRRRYLTLYEMRNKIFENSTTSPLGVTLLLEDVDLSGPPPSSGKGFLSGGKAPLFATALFWAAGISSSYTLKVFPDYEHYGLPGSLPKTYPKLQVLLHGGGRARWFYAHVAMARVMKKVLAKTDSGFQVVEFSFQERVHLPNAHHREMLEQILNEVYFSLLDAGLLVCCCFMSMAGWEGKHYSLRHVVGLYPCHASQSSLTWSICDTSKLGCNLHFRNGMRILHDNHGLAAFVNLGYVVSHRLG